MNSLLAGLLATVTHGAEAAPDAASHAEATAHGPAPIIMHHVLDVRYFDLVLFGINFGPTKHLLFLALACLLTFALVLWAKRGYVQKGLPTGAAAFLEILVVYVRDEIAEKNIGHGDGRKFTPLLLSFFFLILIAAMFGLAPVPQYQSGHWTIAEVGSTANLSITLGLAMVSFAAQQWAGIYNFGLAHHLKNLVPPGLPFWLLPIMIPVELLGVFSKPFALMVRLFANMLAGHMVVSTLLLLIPLMAGVQVFFGVGMIPISLSLALFIKILEILVAFIQAYIFTLLTAIFIGSYAHPAH
jgi:F-type H+-transporting ATPase subunit a